MVVRSRDWTTLLLLRITFSALHSQTSRLLKKYVLHCARYLVGRYKTLLRNWEFSLMAEFRDTHFVLQKSTNPQNKRFSAQEKCTKPCGTVEV